ncbi:MAG: hypothetical protein Q4B37_07085 [Eubacteriales bacterium]|nr:hypothetical protein [Eubacteriales bacterium]
MSQKKVDSYKKEKANREKLIKKEKRILMLEKLAGIAICAAVVCWIGFSIYDKTQENKEAVVQETEIDTAALDEYLSSLNAEKAEE